MTSWSRNTLGNKVCTETSVEIIRVLFSKLLELYNFSADQNEGYRLPSADSHPEIHGSPSDPDQPQGEEGRRLDRDLPQVRDHLDPGAGLEHREWGPGGPDTRATL